MAPTNARFTQLATDSTVNLTNLTDGKKGIPMTTITCMQRIVEFFTNNNEDAVENVRLPYLGTGKFDPLHNFRINPGMQGEYTEVPDVLLERLPEGTPFMMYISNDAKHMQRINSNGWVNSEDGKRWKVFFLFPKDQHIKAFLVPWMSAINVIDDIGMHAHLKSTRKQGLKLGKYASRTFVPTHTHMHGENLSFDSATGIGIRQLQNGSSITIRHQSFEGVDPRIVALLDGALFISPRGAIALGLSADPDNPVEALVRGLRPPKLGDVWHGHGIDDVSFFKGDIILVPWLEVDLMVWGGKPILTADWFYFGSLGPVTEGMVHSDAQSVINFKQHALLKKAGTSFMVDLYNSCKDSKSLRKFALKHIRSIQAVEKEENGVVNYDGFVLAEALRRRIDPLMFPGLLRKVVNFLTKKVMDFNRLRVPLDKSHKYAHCIPDIYTIQANGDCNLLSSQVPAGQMAYPDLAGGTDVVVNRQPNENSNAFFALTIFDDPKGMYRKFRGRGICILGPGLNEENPGALEILARLGGGDMDDTFVITHDPIWVGHFSTLPRYPEVDKAQVLADHNKKSGPGDGTYADEFSEAMAAFDEALEAEADADSSSYGRKQFSTAIRTAQASGVGIGPVVNFLITDFELSDPETRAFMLDQLDKRAAIAKGQKKYKIAKTLRERRDWLANREPFQGKLLATFLELVIDGAAKGENMEILGDVREFLKTSHENTQVYPTLCDWGKVRADGSHGRIPASKRAAKDYVLVDTPVCKAVRELMQIRTRLFNKLTDLGWKNVRPASDEILSMFPEDEFIKNVVHGNRHNREEEPGIRKTWNAAWIEFHTMGQAGEAERSEAFKRIEQSVTDLEVSLDLDDNQMKEVAVELYRSVYTGEYEAAEIDEDGKSKGFSDGLLWTTRHANALFAAMDDAEVTAITRRVELDRFYRRLADSTVQVVVRNGVVRRLTDNSDLGAVSNCPDGFYMMSDGEICLREATSAVCLDADDIRESEDDEEAIN